MPIRQWLSRLLSPGCCLLAAALAGVWAPLAFGTDAEAKTPGATYCFVGKCHRVKTLAETQALIGREELLETSFYDDCSRDRYNPCGLTSSGEVFRPFDDDNAASPILPNGTLLLVRNPQTQGTAIIRVNNAGPYWGNRKLDVSRGVAEKLGFKGQGVAKLEVRVLKAPSPSEARYSKNRRYDAVPGYVGQFASADAANTGLTAFMAMQTMTTSLFGDAGQVVLAAAGLDAPEVNASERIRIAGAKASRAAKSTRVASARKSYGKRKYASSRKSKTRYAAYRAKNRYASASRGKRRYASSSRARFQQVASVKRGYRGKAGYAARHRARTTKVAWNQRLKSKSKSARGRSGKRFAAVERRRS